MVLDARTVASWRPWVVKTETGLGLGADLSGYPLGFRHLTVEMLISLQNPLACRDGLI